MSSAIQPMITLGESFGTIGRTAQGGHKLARRICQSLVFLPLFALMLEPEYLQGIGDPEAKSILYRMGIGPFRIVDAALLGLIAAHVMVWASSRVSRIGIPRSLVVPGSGFLFTISIAAIYGVLQGGANFFFDWRALALGIGIYVVFAMWMQTAEDTRPAILLFAGFLAVRIAFVYWRFLRGGGDMLVGIRIPLFDGPTLSAVGFTGVLALSLSDAAANRWGKLCWIGLSTASYLLVLLCFRRTFWAELGIGTLFLFVIQRRGRGRKLLLATLVAATVVGVMGQSFFGRVRSMDFSNGEAEFSQGNPDHVGEVLDAWEQVQRQPLMGIGLGRSFQTLRVQTWKEQSVMVHNAPLHVWLKYGLLGLVCYMWFHFAVLRWLWRIRKHDQVEKVRHPRLRLIRSGKPFSPATPVASAVLAYLAAQFVVSLGFAPWPYSSLQSTTLIAFLLAMATAGTRLCNFQPSR